MLTAVSAGPIRRVGALTTRRRRPLLALALATVVLGVAPAVSQATAIGIQYWGPFTFQGVTLPGGQLTHVIKGGHDHIDWDGANFASVGNLCDSSMKFTYGNGKLEYTGSPAHSNVHWGCSHGGQWKYYWNWSHVPRGSACAELWIKNWRHRVTKQCHYVY